MNLAEHRAALVDGADPADLVAAAYDRLAAWNDPALCIHVVARDQAMARARSLDRSLPLCGVPVAIKDNLDLAGAPTTAGCPAFSYVATRSAAVVERLESAGAVIIAKTNLDQFATGLVGVRSPYGIPRNPLAPERIPGGSSSGSAVIVAAGIVPIALGTDTAGSGRVPAACTGIVGWKPTCGALSTRGLVPAVRSLDCVSIFAGSVGDCAEVAALLTCADAEDVYSRQAQAASAPELAGLRLGVLPDSWLAPCTAAVAASYRQAVARAVSLEMVEKTIDFTVFAEAAAALYAGPWVAERTAAVGDFLADHPGAGHPVVASIIAGGRRFSAVEAYRARDRLLGLRRQAAQVWSGIDALLLPTIPGLPTIDVVLADPIAQNSLLGTYTNFANLLDTCAVAVPQGRDGDGLPFGVTVFAPAWHEPTAARVACALVGESAPDVLALRDPATLTLAVCGAHLRGMPLHRQLLDLNARFLEETRTAATYRLFRLPTTPAKPALVRVTANGAPITVELYAIAAADLGRLMATVAAPLGIGRITLADGRAVHGFLGEAAATAGCADITAAGGWREHLGGA
ncbi:allophanate hydrolase [Planctomycetota bacterium]|nr:allophanate hydrolase [Planctomycetota bacterium]